MAKQTFHEQVSQLLAQYAQRTAPSKRSVAGLAQFLNGPTEPEDDASVDGDDG